jgi:hypothetical protein
MRYRLDPLSPTGLSPVEKQTIIRTGGGAVHTGARVLNDLSDVVITSTPTDNQALAYDTATGKWIPQTISGGGTTSPLTTKGDVYTFTTLEARLGVGTDGQVLTANSAQLTGLEWTTIASAGSTTINNYSSLLAPQLFNPDAAGVTAGTDDFTLSSVSNVAFVTQNGQVLDDSEYSLVSSTLTVTPDNGFTDTADEILVFQYSYTLATNGGAVFNLVQKSATYTISTSDYYIECTTNSFPDIRDKKLRNRYNHSRR